MLNNCLKCCNAAAMIKEMRELVSRENAADVLSDIAGRLVTFNADGWPMLHDMQHELLTGRDELANLNEAVLALLQKAGPRYLAHEQMCSILQLLHLLSNMLIVQAQMRKEKVSTAA
jgi:hypothetical protein